MEGWTIIFNALRDSPISKITTWDLSGEELGPGIAKPLADYISVTTSSVTSVVLLGNRFDNATVAMLLKLKEDKPNLTTLCGLKLDQSEADFCGWGLTPQDAKLLAPEVLVLASLTLLDVRYNSLDEEGEAVLRKAVESRSGFKLEL